MLTDKCTELFSTSVNEGYTVQIDGEKQAFKTNLMGLVRFSAQNHKATTAAVYSIIYWALVIYTCVFTIMYFKRFLYMAFFTMIAPLVALTYPIDKVGDGKSQAFNMWFKEYTMNAIIQPIHLILYTVFVGSAYNLVAKNPIYALVAIFFLIPAEKFIKKMFGLDKAESTSGFGSFAGGALAMSGLKHLSNLGPGGKSKKESGGSGDSSDEEGNSNYRSPNEAGDLSSFDSDAQQQEARQQMLDADDENFGGQDWDAQQRDALAREQSQNDGGMQYNDDEYAQILRDSGYSEEEIAQMMGGNGNSVNNDGQQGQADSSRQGDAQNSGEKPKRSVVGAAGRVVARGAGSVGRQVWRNKGRYAKAAAGFAAKTGVRAAGAAAFAMPALAAGLTTGDFSKAMQFTATGAAIGATIGGKTYDNAVEPLASGAVNVARNARNAYQEERFGNEEAERRQRERQNARAKKDFMSNEKEIKKYRELASKMGYNGSVKNLMEAASDYKEAGVTDDTMIQNALKAEYRTNKSVGGSNNQHKQYVDMASFAHQNGFGKDHIEDDKKRTSFENVISSKLQKPKDQKQAAQTLAEIFDRGDMYKKVGKLGK